jgi:hypothetical protein
MTSRQCVFFRAEQSKKNTAELLDPENELRCFETSMTVYKTQYNIPEDNPIYFLRLFTSNSSAKTSRKEIKWENQTRVEGRWLRVSI